MRAGADRVIAALAELLPTAVRRDARCGRAADMRANARCRLAHGVDRQRRPVHSTADAGPDRRADSRAADSRTRPPIRRRASSTPAPRTSGRVTRSRSPTVIRPFGWAADVTTLLRERAASRPPPVRGGSARHAVGVRAGRAGRRSTAARPPAPAARPAGAGAELRRGNGLPPVARAVLPRRGVAGCSRPPRAPAIWPRPTTSDSTSCASSSSPRPGRTGFRSRSRCRSPPGSPASGCGGASTRSSPMPTEVSPSSIGRPAGRRRSTQGAARRAAGLLSTRDGRAQRVGAGAVRAAFHYVADRHDPRAGRSARRRRHRRADRRCDRWSFGVGRSADRSRRRAVSAAVDAASRLPTVITMNARGLAPTGLPRPDGESTAAISRAKGSADGTGR